MFLQFLQHGEVAFGQFPKLLLPPQFPAAHLLQPNAGHKQPQEIPGGQRCDYTGRAQPQNLRPTDLIPQESAAAQAHCQRDQKLRHLRRSLGPDLQLGLQLGSRHGVQRVFGQFL